MGIIGFSKNLMADSLFVNQLRDIWLYRTYVKAPKVISRLFGQVQFADKLFNFIAESFAARS